MTPAAREDALAWLRLTLVPGVPPALQRLLMSAFGTPEQVLAASRRDVASIAGNEVAAALAAGADAQAVERALAWIAVPGQHLIALGDPNYPGQLLTIADPPNVLYARGRLELLNAPAIAIVGSRNATPQGVEDARAFAQALSEAGLAIVSGLALGIDAAAHRGGLEAGGSSIAVMGTGADRIYPARNRDLARALATHGALVTEFALGTVPAAGNFPKRNRLISGLSRGVLVVEAALRSGSLVTARLAVDQGREVFAIPGSIHSPVAKGCHDLIKQGAKLVESADDILAELRWGGSGGERPGPREDREDPLLEAMGFGPVSIDQMAERTGEGAAAIAAGLSRLEIEGRVAALAGGLFQRLQRAG